MRWYRRYSDAHRNHKIRRLTDPQFRLWDLLLSMAAEREKDGLIGTMQDIVLTCTRRAATVQRNVQKLVQVLLIEQHDGRYYVHNWNARQFLSDQSTQRVREHRKRSKPVTGNVTETPPYSEQNRLQKGNVTNGGLEPIAVAVGRSLEALPPATAFDLGERREPRAPTRPKGVHILRNTPAYDAWWKFLKKPAKLDAFGGWTFDAPMPPALIPVAMSPSDEDKEIPF